MSAESFTVLAILEARDRASEIFAKVDESLDKFSDTADRAAETARVAGTAIDDALGRDVDVSDRLEVATARLEAAQAKAAESANALTDAERELLDAQRASAAASDDDSAATDRLIEANARLSGAQKDAAVSAKGLRDAEAGQVEAMRAAAAAGDENAASQLRLRESSEESGLSLGGMGKFAGIAALGLGVAGALMVKAAGNFQDSTTHLVTDAGESARNLAMVQAGILNVSTATGTSASAITDAMYHIESGGYHGAAGLTMLKVAAEGARVGGADLDTVSKTLVGTMNAYGMSASKSASMMNQLIATVGAGDMRMQDLASSLSAVTPVAAAAHLSFAQVGGAIATMTSQGMSAQQASQDLANMLRNILKPSATASQEMRALGLSANKVSQSLSRQGLTGTLQTYTDAILKNSQGGSVLLGYMKQMSPAAQGLARSILSGTIGTKALRDAVYNLNPQQAKLISLFESAATSATGLKQTYTGAMATLTGGATGLNVALMLSGKHMATFSQNVATVAAAAKKGGGQVANWSTIQSTFNFKVAQAKTAVENTGIAIGSALLPAVTKLLTGVTHVIVPIAEWTAKHKSLTSALFIGVTAIAATVGAIAVAHKAFTGIKGAVSDAKDAFQGAKTAIKAVRDGLKALPDLASSVASGFSQVTSSLGNIASTAGSAISAAAQTAAGWVSTGAKAAWAAVQILAAKTAQLAAAAASRLLAGAQAVLNAIMDANPIMLVVVAFAALTAGVIYAWTHFETFRKVVEDVFGWLKRAVSDVIGFVRTHWLLIVEIIGGPLAIAVVQVVKHWNDIKKWFRQGVHDVKSILSWFGSLPSKFAGWIRGAADAVGREGKRVLHWFEQLPGKVGSYLSGLPGQMLTVGENIVKGIWNGLGSMGSWLESKVSSFASSVLGSIGHAFGIGSPSKYTTVHGQWLGAGIATGIIKSIPTAAAAARRMAASVLAATAGMRSGGIEAGSTLANSAVGPAVGGGAAGGITVINLNVTGNYVMSDADINKLVERMGKQLATQILPSAGRKIQMRG